MATRYKLRNGETVFNYNGNVVNAGADGWIRPVDAAMEKLLIQAGAAAASVVTSEDAAGGSNPLQIPRDGSLGGGGGGGSSTLSALTDMGTYDIATNNPSVATVKATANAAATATALAATNAALNVQSTDSQTGTAYTLVLSDAGQNVDMNNASANTLTIPPNSSVAFPVGTVITVTMAGAGVTTIAPGAAVTIVKPVARSLAISAQYETAQLYKAATDTWRVLAG